MCIVAVPSTLIAVVLALFVLPAPSWVCIGLATLLVLVSVVLFWLGIRRMLQARRQGRTDFWILFLTLWGWSS